MKKLIIILLSILILLIGVRIIMCLLDPPIHYALDKKNSFIDSLNTYNYGDYFKTYSIEGLSNFEYTDDDFTIECDGNILKVNDNEFDVVSLDNYFSIYDDELFVISFTDLSGVNILVYNLRLNDFKLISSYKEMLIHGDSPITYSDDGITLSFTSIDGDKFIKNNKSICKTKDKSKDVIKTLLYKYDVDKKAFSNVPDTIYSISLKTYIDKYDLCD